MKPTWNNAPSWARYLAMDADGRWHWAEFEPIVGDGEWLSVGGFVEFAGEVSDSWRDTLEARPQEIEI